MSNPIPTKPRIIEKIILPQADDVAEARPRAVASDLLCLGIR